MQTYKNSAAFIKLFVAVLLQRRSVGAGLSMMKTQRWMSTRFSSRQGRWVILACLLLASCSPVTGPAPGVATPQEPAPGDSGANARATLTPVPTPQPPQSTLSVRPAELNGVEVVLWHAWSGAEASAFSGLVSQFNRQNPWGVVAHAQSFPGFDALQQAMTAALQAGSPPNAAAAYLYQALEWEDARAVLVELDAYVTDPVWGLSAAEQADFFPAFWEHDQSSSRASGRLGVPAQRSAQMLFYNVTWAQELGFASAPTTLTQLKMQACAAAQANRQDDNRENDATGGLILSTHYSSMLGWLHAFGAQVTRPDGTGYQWDQPEVQQAFRYLRDLYDGGCAWLPDELGSQDPHLAFASRQGLFAAGSASAIPAQEGVFANLQSKDEWTVLPFPGQGGRQVVETYGPSFFVLKASQEEQLAAWLLVRWLVSPESQASLAQATAWLPVNNAGLRAVSRLAATHPQWGVAASLLGDARSEPTYRSWRTVRWALSDAATQLFRYYFTIDQVPQLVELLDQTAAEFHP